jgi:hypothetical protein
LRCYWVSFHTYIMIFYLIFIFRCRQADFFATVLWPVYRRYNMAGFVVTPTVKKVIGSVVVTSNKLIAANNLSPGLLTLVNNLTTPVINTKL